MKIHIVQKGDTLWDISQQYGVNFEELKQLNPQISSPDMIMPGMKIKIPASSKPVKNEGVQQKNVSKAEQPPVAEELYQDSSPKPMPLVQEDDSEPPKEMKPKMPQPQTSMPAYPQMPSSSNMPQQSHAEMPGSMPAMPSQSGSGMLQHPEIPGGTNMMPWPSGTTQPYMTGQLHTQPIIYNTTYCFPQMPACPAAQQGSFGMQSNVYQQPYQETSYQFAPYSGSGMHPGHYAIPQQQGCGCAGYQSMPMYQQPPIAQQPMPISQPMPQYPVNASYAAYTGYMMDSPESSESIETPPAPMLYPNMTGDYNPYGGMGQGYSNPQTPPAYYDTSAQQPAPMPPNYGNMYREEEEEEDWSGE